MKILLFKISAILCFHYVYLKTSWSNDYLNNLSLSAKLLKSYEYGFKKFMKFSMFFLQFSHFNLSITFAISSFAKIFFIDILFSTFSFQTRKTFSSHFSPFDVKFNLYSSLLSHHQQMVLWHFALRNRDTRCHSISIDFCRAITENTEHGISNGETETLSPLAVRCDDVMLACESHRTTHIRRALEHAESVPENGKLLGRAVYRFAKALRQVLE